jgi:hypothetical protein
MRRLLALAALAGLVLGGLGSAAFAQTISSGLDAATVAVRPSDDPCGSTVLVSGTDWMGGTVVTISIGSQTLGSATTGPTGEFSTSVQTPSPLPLGGNSVVASGVDQNGQSESVATTFTVTSCTQVAGVVVSRPGAVVGGIAVPGLTNQQALAFTGSSSNTSLYVAIALVMLLVGLVLTIVTARRRKVRFDA